MKIPENPCLAETVEQAKQIQQKLKHQVILEDQVEEVNYVAGLDVAFQDQDKISQAAVAVLSFPDLELVEQVIIKCPTTFPYIPGFLSFREIPPLLKALEKVTITPDLILCDGQGIAHPQRFGLACHLGVTLNIPCVGVAKSLLVGKHEHLASDKGSWQPLYYQKEIVGAALRTRSNTKPVYVSSGHRLSLPTAIDYVMRCTPKYRLPETTRYADKLSKQK